MPYSKWLFASKINWIKCSFFNSFLTSKCFVLFQLAFLLRIISLISKSVYVTKFARANPAPKTSAVNLLNSGVVIYLSWLWSATLFSISPMFVLQSAFLTQLITLGILFSIAVNAEVVAKPLTLGILIISPILTL